MSILERVRQISVQRDDAIADYSFIRIPTNSIRIKKVINHDKISDKDTLMKFDLNKYKLFEASIDKNVQDEDIKIII